MAVDYIIIFGAAVRAGGRPSAALQHRIDGALLWARQHPSAMIMPTGGVGDAGPSEAVAMKHAVVASGIKASRIILEPTGRDALESVRRCDAILRKGGDCGRAVTPDITLVGLQTLLADHGNASRARHDMAVLNRRGITRKKLSSMHLILQSVIIVWVGRYVCRLHCIVLSSNVSNVSNVKKPPQQQRPL